MAPFIASTIPGEIIEWIVYRAVKWTLHTDQDKSLLGVCCLVCRSWAQICRPAMFDDITIWSGEELDELFELLSTPSDVVPQLADCLLWIQAVEDGPSKFPWVHRVPIIQQYTFQRVELGLEVANMTEHAITGIWDALLPHSLPPSSRLISHLELKKIRFRRVADLLRAVRSFPVLEATVCTEISFDDPSLVQRIPPNGRRRLSPIQDRRQYACDDIGSLLTIVANHDRDDLQAQSGRELVFLLMAEMRPWRYSLLTDHLWNAFRDLILGLKHSCTSDLDMANHSLLITAVPKDYLALEFRISNIGHLTLNVKPETHSGVSIKFTLSGKADHVMAWDWNAFEAAVLKLNPVPVLHLSADDEDVFKAMLDAVFNNSPGIMGQLNGLERLRLSYSTGRDSEKPITAEDIQARPTQYNVDGCSLVLSASQRFGLILWEKEGKEPLLFLRGLLEKSREETSKDVAVEKV